MCLGVRVVGFLGCGCLGSDLGSCDRPRLLQGGANVGDEAFVVRVLRSFAARALVARVVGDGVHGVCFLMG